MEDRRRYPRRSAESEFMAIPTALSVKILDISVAGAFVESRHPMDPGSRGRLRLNLDGLPITVDVQIQRVVEGAAVGSGYRIGASFLALDPKHRQLIEHFVTQ